MQVHVYVDGVQVGTRTGCDVLVEGRSCMQAGVGASLFSGGYPRDICAACMARLGSGSPPLEFASHRYDIANEAFSTEPTPPKVEAPAAPSEPGPPAFPACPHCGERAFTVTQVLSESRGYQWQAEALRFASDGDPTVAQSTLYHCRACGHDVPADLLSSWIA